MRVLVIYPGYALYNRDLFMLLERLAVKENHTVDVLFVRKERRNESFYNDFSISSNFNASYLNFKGIRVNDYTINTALRLVTKLLRSMRDKDIIFTSTQAPFHSKVAFFINIFLRKKFIVFVEQWKSTIDKGLFFKFYKRLDKLVLTFSDIVLVHGNAQRKFVNSNVRRGVTVKQFAFTSRIDGTGKMESPNKTDGPIKFIYFGRVTEQKGLDILIEAFIGINHNATLEIYGGVDELNFSWESEDSRKYLQKCMNLACKDERITFHGSVDPRYKLTAFRDADVFVHPHKEFRGLTEGWGLVVNEAMLCSLPIIATSNVGSAHTLIRNGFNGFVVEPSNVYALREKMETFIQNPILIRKFGRRSYQMINDYQDIKIMYETLAGILS